MTVDLLGSAMSESEERLIAVYEELKALCAMELPPNAHANVAAALALKYEHLSDLGV